MKIVDELALPALATSARDEPGERVELDGAEAVADGVVSGETVTVDGAAAVADGGVPGDVVDEAGAVAVFEGGVPGDVVTLDGAVAVLDGVEPGEAVVDDGAAADDEPIAGHGDPLALNTCPGRQPPAGAGAFGAGDVDGDAEGSGSGEAAFGVLWASAGAVSNAAHAAANNMRFIRNASEGLTNR